MVYGHEAVLPWELKMGSRRISLQDQLTVDDYSILMKGELEDLASHRLRALISIEENKKKEWPDGMIRRSKSKSFPREIWSGN